MDATFEVHEMTC